MPISKKSVFTFLDFSSCQMTNFWKFYPKQRLVFIQFCQSFIKSDHLIGSTEFGNHFKDPTRVQPHLKKCFEGVAKLNFNPNLEILAMISSEKEEIPFDQIIYPADARGMVEKWLVEVEHAMLSNVRRVTLEGTEDYTKKERRDWVQQWPGMVVISGSQVFWTQDLETDIVAGQLDNRVKILNSQIDEIVELVRGKLPNGIRITLSALTVIDVHARDVTVDLADIKVSQANDFNWLSQLRYYIHHEATDEMFVHLINTEYRYG